MIKINDVQTRIDYSFVYLSKGPVKTSRSTLNGLTVSTDLLVVNTVHIHRQSRRKGYTLECMPTFKKILQFTIVLQYSFPRGAAV